jgi:acyl-coenzyme A thioesterase PaaI-like protein
MQRFAPAITLSANLLANGREGHLHAKTRIVTRGRRLSMARIEVTSDEGKVLLDLTTTPVVAEG